jgi:hypothetical protein
MGHESARDSLVREWEGKNRFVREYIPDNEFINIAAIVTYLTYCRQLVTVDKRDAIIFDGSMASQ